MGKRQSPTTNGNGGGAQGATQGYRGHRLELGRGQVNLEFLKRFGTLNIPGVGEISLLYRNPIRGKVSVHFNPSDDLIAYLAEENGYDREEFRIGELDADN